MAERRYYWTECGWSWALSDEPTYTVRIIMGHGTVEHGYSDKRAPAIVPGEMEKQLG